MNSMQRRNRWHLAVEYTFVLAILAALGHIAWYFVKYGYLRQPFFYEPYGTWSDWFSLAQYAHRRGAYDIEMSIYPPLSFTIMKVLSIKQCYANNFDVNARYCDWLGDAAVCGFFLLAGVLTFFHFRKVDRATYIPRSIAVALGFPMLYAWERGNLITVTYCAYLLAYGPLLKSARLRWLCAGIAVNLKVYLIAAVLAPLAKRRWVAVEGAVLATIGVYIVTWIILGEGNPLLILRNITQFSGITRGERLLDIWFASSLSPIRTVMQSNFPVYTVFSSTQADVIYLTATGLTYLTQGLAVAGVVATYLRPEVVPHHRVILFGTIIALATSEAGGYTGILLLLSIFMERWRGWARPTAIVLAYIYCIPDDYIIPAGMPPMLQESFLGNRQVLAQYGIGALSVMRPVLMFIACNCLAGVTLHDVWKDMQNQGWKGRWRFRRDRPLLPGIARPQSPHRVD